MKSLSKKAKVWMALAIVVVLVANVVVLVATVAVMLVVGNDKPDTSSYINIYINSEKIDKNEQYILYKYDGREVDVKPVVVFRGKENGVAGHINSSKLLIDETTIPHGKINLYSAKPKEVGCYLLSYYFEYADSQIDYDGAIDRSNIKLYIYDEEGLDLRMYKDETLKQRLFDGDTVAYKDDGRPHNPVLNLFLSKGNVVGKMATAELLHNGKKIEPFTAWRAGSYRLTIYYNGVVYGQKLFEEQTITINFVIE